MFLNCRRTFRSSVFYRLVKQQITLRIDDEAWNESRGQIPSRDAEDLIKVIPIHSDDAMFSKPDSLHSRLCGNDDTQLVTGIHGAVRMKWYKVGPLALGNIH